MITLSQCPGIDPSGVNDSLAGLKVALNTGLPITWDCPVLCSMGVDYTKSLFLPSGSDVTFVPRGQMIVDNVGFPALCFYNASAIWRGTNISYVGSFGTSCIAMPTTPNRWNDMVAKTYLTSAVNPLWTGPTNTSAVISVRGSSGVQFLGGQMTVPPGTSAANFMPVAMAFDGAYGAGGATITPTAMVQDFFVDGVLMGFVGSGALTFARVTRGRYSDLQDAAGNNVGGINTWFAPPHFFYLDSALTSPPLTGSMRDIVDLGQYVGNPLRRSSQSGMMHSLKLELANGFLVDGYYSRCLDGGFDCLSMGRSIGGTLRNAHFEIDSSIKTIDGAQVISPLRFPSPHAMPPGTDIDLSWRDRGAVRWANYVPPPSSGVRLKVAGECG